MKIKEYTPSEMILPPFCAEHLQSVAEMMLGCQKSQISKLDKNAITDIRCHSNMISVRVRTRSNIAFIDLPVACVR